MISIFFHNDSFICECFFSLKCSWCWKSHIEAVQWGIMLTLLVFIVILSISLLQSFHKTFWIGIIFHRIVEKWFMKMSSVLIFLCRESTSVIEQLKQREIENTHPVIESKYGFVGQRLTFFAEVYFTMQKISALYSHLEIDIWFLLYNTRVLSCIKLVGIDRWRLMELLLFWNIFLGEAGWWKCFTGCQFRQACDCNSFPPIPDAFEKVWIIFFEFLMCANKGEDIDLLSSNFSRDMHSVWTKSELLKTRRNSAL